MTASHPYLDKDRQKIQGLFDSIAPRYDFLNHFLSLGIDLRWRRSAVEALGPRPGGRYLDACCGTGDLGVAILKDGEKRRRNGEAPYTVIASDFSLGMLHQGARKRRTPHHPQLLAGDTMQLPFPDNTFDGATVAFGIRNVQDLPAGLAELARVIRPGGRVVILEFTPLQVPVFGPLFHFYLEHVLPRIGNFISRSRSRAYTYLNDSIRRWPDGETLADRMREAGFCAVKWRSLFPGNVALHAATKEP